MAEKLLVRFSNAQLQSFEWLSIDTPQAQVQSGTWQDLTDAAKDKQLILLLPASAVLLLEITLPIKNIAQLKKALPFALEDMLADDVENYHLVWLKQPQDKVVVAAIPHEKLAAYLALFKDADLELDAVCAEPLCLSYQDGACSVLIEAEQAVFRTGQWQGGGIDTNFLPVLLGKLRDEGRDCQQLRLWSRQSVAELSEILPFEYIEQPLITPLQLFAEGINAALELNLLSGRYARQSKAKGRWQQWLPAVVIVVIAMSIQTGMLMKQTWQQQAQLEALEAQTLDLFKQTFPDIKRVVNVKAQADQQLIELKKHSNQSASAFMHILYQSGEHLKDNSALQLKKLNFANGSLLMQLNAPDIGQLEQFKQQIATSLQVKIQSADSGTNGVEAHLEIREK
ncbi:MAG: type II secretion system protein GspL [Methylomonas sp.]|nr:MAG: type II secretion system protein GspL [Methylomonas sp.]